MAGREVGHGARPRAWLGARQQRVSCGIQAPLFNIKIVCCCDVSACMGFQLQQGRPWPGLPSSGDSRRWYNSSATRSRTQQCCHTLSMACCHGGGQGGSRLVSARCLNQLLPSPPGMIGLQRTAPVADPFTGAIATTLAARTGWTWPPPPFCGAPQLQQLLQSGQ